MLKLKVKERDPRRQLTCDLKEGDIALINYDVGQTLVYVFRADTRHLTMVALNRCIYWDNIRTTTLEVIRVLQSGDELVVT